MKTKTIEELKAELAKWNQKALDAEQKSAQWLMKANDINENKICGLELKIKNMEASQVTGV